MEEVFSLLLTPQVKMWLRVAGWALLILYIAGIIWVYRDAEARSRQPWLWFILGFIPVIGPIVYMMVRPPLYLVDKMEQQLEMARLEREAISTGACPRCGYPLEREYLICPSCTQRVRNQCEVCERALDPSWRACPYCRTPVSQQQ